MPIREPESDAALRAAYRRWERALADSLADRPARVLAAVSGGCDSILLAWLLRLSAERGRLGGLILGHVNHGLRPEAAQEEAFVRRFAETSGLPMRVARLAPIPDGASGESLEEAARWRRHAALAELARAAACDAVALGHQMDDQAETLLLRILRGTGPRGLGAMQPRGRLPLAPPDTDPGSGAPILIRPLLGFRRREIRSLADSFGLEWIEDPSNRDRRLLRNRVRCELIPQLETEYNPRLVESLADLAHWQRPTGSASRAPRSRRPPTGKRPASCVTTGRRRMPIGG
jgi:tRNA(Ile)-lysidine synthase